MKKFLLVNFACLLSFSVFSQWTNQVGPSVYLSSVYFTDPSTGYAVASNGNIIKTSNAGVNWSILNTAGSSLYSVNFVNANTGWAIGASGAILKSSDAGASWLNQSSGTTYALNSSSFIDQDTGYIVGNGGTILKSTNGGSFWQAKTSGTTNDLLSVYFTNPSTGYAVGFSGIILKTVDAGQTWMPVTSGTNNNLLSVYFTDANNGYVSGANGTLLKTADAGNTWATISSGSSYPLYSIRFPDANNGYAVGGSGTILKTNDAGNTWYIQNSGTISDLIGVYFIDTNNGYAVGASDTIRTTIDGGCATPAVSISGLDIVCIGSSVTLTASGASTYLWNTSETTPNISSSPSVNTTYSVTGTSTDGCVNSAVFSISVNTLPGITTTPNDITCNGMCNGSTSAVVTGGTAPYMYQWSTGSTTSAINTLCAGVYTVTVTDANGCVDSVTSPISEPSPISIFFSPLVNATCVGTSDGAATANVSGGTPGYSYSWSDGSTSQSISGIMTADYTVTVTDTNSCTASAIATIGTNSASPTATISGPGNSCQGQPVTFTGSATGGTTPYTYDWADLQLGSQSSTTTSCAIAPTLCGYDTINLKVVDVNGCTGYASASLFINYSDSLSGFVFDTNSVAVTSGYVYLFQQKINHVGLYDTIGIASIHPNGYYTFPNVFYGDYFVKVEADTSVYPTAIATYYSNKPNAYQWDSALVINHYTCNASNAVGYDVHIIQLPGSLTGPGTISGIITADTSFGHRYGNGNYLPMGAPLKGVDVKLGKNPGGTASARTTTDNSGNYTFNNVPIGDYKIYVDIPNYGMDSVLAISITATNTVSANNNYYVDSVMIRVDAGSSVGIKTNISSVNAIVIYPNPANTFVIVHAEKELGAITIYNSLGEVVYRSFPNLSQAKEIKIDMGNLLRGVYILQVQNRFMRLIKE